MAVQKVYLCVYCAGDAGPAGKRRPLERGIPVAAGPGPAVGTVAESRPRTPATTRSWSPGWKRGPARPAAPPAGRSCPTAGVTSFPRCGPGAPDGSLRLRLLSDSGLSAIVFLVVVCGGLILLPAGLGRRALAVGAGDHRPGAGGRLLPDLLHADRQRRAGGGRLSSCWWCGAWRTWHGAAGRLGDGQAVPPRAAKPLPKTLAAALDAGLPRPRCRGAAARQRRPRKRPAVARASPQARERRRPDPCVTHISKNPTLRVVSMPPSPPYSVLAICLAAGAALAQQANPTETNPPEKVREIFVPFKDLNILLENQPRRVLLSRQQYDELLKKAKITPSPARPPGGRADRGRLQRPQRRAAGAASPARWPSTCWKKGLQAVPLDLGGVGLLSAKLDDRDAPIGRAPDGGLSLLVEGVGRHALVLEMVAPLETTAARQMLFFRLPRAAAGRLRLVVPGDVEIRSGADVAGRVVDRAAGVTRFELLPTAGDATLVMSLNSHLQRREQAVIARSVLVDEVTAGLREALRHGFAGDSLPGGGSLPLRRARGLRDHRDQLAAAVALGRQGGERSEDRQRPLARADDRDRGVEHRGGARAGAAGRLAVSAMGAAGRGGTRGRAGPAGRAAA